MIQMRNGDTLTAVMSGAAGTTNPRVLVESQDDAGPSTSWVALAGATTVTLLTGGPSKDLFATGLSVTNNDSAAITVTINQVVDGTASRLTKKTLQVDDTLTYANGAFTVSDVNGQVRQANASTVPTALTGAFTDSVGASTAAAGSTYADAGALPAGTASVYPTTAADGTKGVIINAADQVTGRTIKIGNGVSNAILKVYGPAGATINGASANAAFSSASGKGVTITCLSAAGNTWLAQ